ncbi:threonine ammonia-lyase [Petrocella sp. FN5]|uniref:threonine ammonia-lyase n=1 Tax=Petrocella sp. FN5 TaxID=3032002 RepID=UPI0023DA3AAD|nr:threonine ammonia-lyase [Petrocella sp. FN5]MDF1616460.1 threonine ammonia-lyase [Petrocella sp. FN5]
MQIEMIKEAADLLADVIKKTPLIYSQVFSAESGNEVYLKPENLQITGAFKIRGAYNKVSHLTEVERSCGIVAASAGNHAQGVAFAANKLGVKATIVMPSQTPLIKIEATREYGAEVVLFGDCYDDAHGMAMEIHNDKGATIVHPFDDPYVIAGQGTIGLEIMKDLEDVDIVIVPIGGGGLISGIACAIKEINPKIRVIGVEPKGAQTLNYSMQNNCVSELTAVSTIAEGVAVKRPGELTFSMVKNYVDEIVVVSDVDVLEAFLLMVEKEKLIVENAGVLSLAALKKLPYKNKKIVSVISGGNIDVVTISEMINRGLISRGRLFCFSVELHDTPGELLKIAKILADHKANVIKLEHNQFKTIDRFMHVQLEITLETNGHKHVKEIKKALRDENYHVTVVY